MVKLYEDWLLEAFADNHSKNAYVELQRKDIQEYEKEIIDLIVNAYKHIGGNIEIQKPGDILKSDLNYWVAVDNDNDPDADIVLGGKTTPAGTKMTVLGQDGSTQSKRDAISKTISLMKTRGFYAEMDVDLADKMGLTRIKDEKVIRKVLNKDIQMNADGSYSRDFAGAGKHTKVLVGIPKI